MAKKVLQKKLVMLIFWLNAVQCFGQNHFVCRGNFFLSFSTNSETSVFEANIDPNTNEAVYNILPGPPMNFLFNAMGYRSTDNFIYGIKSTAANEDLIRIDANGNSQQLETLFDLVDDLVYPAGDITPDGKYLVVAGAKQFGGGGFTEDIAMIELDSGTYKITSIEPEPNNFTFADIAFDPIDGQLYGFDNESNSLILIDHNEGTFQAPFPPTLEADYLGALFFDVVGNLFGYGAPVGGFSQNTLFAIDKTTGVITVVEEGPTVQRSDGCSCPYTIDIHKTAEPQQTVPCTPITYEINILNATGETQSGLVFEDQFPPGFNILEVNSSITGNVISGVGTNLLLMQNIVLPPDSSLITIIVEAETGVTGIQSSQATIGGMSLLLGTTVFSDDLTTDIINDPTNILIDPFDVVIDNLPTEICEGDSLLIAPQCSVGC